MRTVLIPRAYWNGIYRPDNRYNSLESDRIGCIEAYLTDAGADAAYRVIATVFKSANILLDHPRMGWAGRVSGTRERILGGLRYLIVYRNHSK